MRNAPVSKDGAFRYQNLVPELRCVAACKDGVVEVEAVRLISATFHPAKAIAVFDAN
jgi:hypothetical protein